METLKKLFMRDYSTLTRRRLARAYLNQCQIAAQKLVHEHGVRFAPSTSEEFQVFPHEISVYMKQLLQDIVSPVLQTYATV